jgi:hypothetical protein
MSTEDIDWFVDKVRNCKAQETLARIVALGDDFPVMRTNWYADQTRPCFDARFPHIKRIVTFDIDDRHMVPDQQVRFRLNAPVSLYTYDNDDTLMFSTTCFSDADRIEAASRINAFV